MLKRIILSTICTITALTLVLGSGDAALSSASETNTRVAAGGAGAEWDRFTPQSVQINAGDSVTWYNPSPVTEPHMVKFISNQSFLPPPAAPFKIPSDTEIVSSIPNPNVEPIILPPGSDNETKTVIMDNARAWNPVVVESSWTNATYLQPNSNYVMTGDELYVNSGAIFPVGLTPPDSPPMEEFTVTFENPGTFEYTCVLHPWMVGNVVVS
jgi:plastocyanin